MPWIPEWAGHQWRDVGVNEPSLLRAAKVSETVEERMIVADNACRADLLSTKKWIRVGVEWESSERMKLHAARIARSSA